MRRFRNALGKLETYTIMIPTGKESGEVHTLRGYDANEIDNLLNRIIYGVTVNAGREL